MNKETRVERSSNGQVERPAQSYIVMAVTVVSLGIVCSLIQCKVSSILPQLSAQFNMDTTTGSLLMSVFTFMGILFSIPAGNTIQRLGAKRVMLGSVVVMVAGSLLGTFAQEPVLLLVSRGIEGVALVFITIAGAAFIRDSAPPEKRASAIGIWSIWFSSGSFLAGIISPLLYESFGFQALWIIYACLAVVAALAIRFIVKAPNVVFKQEYADTVKPRYKELCVRDVVLHLLVFAIYNILTMAIVSYLPTILQGKGYSETSAGFMSTLPMLITIVSVPLLGVISDKLGRVKPLMCGAMFVLVVTTPIILVSTGWQLWAAAIICGLFGASGAALVMVALLAVLPRVEVTPLALGLFSTMQALGMFLGSLLVPLLLETTSLEVTAFILFCIGVVGFVFSLLCRYR